MARFIGIQEAIKQGYNYYVHLDDDDTWTNNHIESINNIVNNFPEVGFIVNKSIYKNISLPREFHNKNNIEIKYNNFIPIPCNSVHSSWTINLQLLGNKILELYKNRINIIEKIKNKEIKEYKFEPFDASILGEFRKLQNNNKIKSIFIPICTVEKKTDYNIPYTMVETIEKEVSNSKSLQKLREINKNIPERSFHEFTHILYDLRTIIGDKEINYLEIGSYVGSSSSLLLHHPFKTNIFCVDPLNLEMSHYNGTLNQEETLIKNLNNNNIYNNKIVIYKNLSDNKILLDKIKNLKIDILFIDGCHKYNSVINDFNNYNNKVNKGGFIVFDDYLDKTHSPDVKKAVDYIIKNYNMSSYKIIGSIKNIKNAKSIIHKKYSNEFVLYKI